jgi:hypothetical protein
MFALFLCSFPCVKKHREQSEGAFYLYLIFISGTSSELLTGIWIARLHIDTTFSVAQYYDLLKF